MRFINLFSGFDGIRLLIVFDLTLGINVVLKHCYIGV